jgi:hypothetical protein
VSIQKQTKFGTALNATLVNRVERPKVAHSLLLVDLHVMISVENLVNFTSDQLCPDLILNHDLLVSLQPVVRG